MPGEIDIQLGCSTTQTPVLHPSYPFSHPTQVLVVGMDLLAHCPQTRRSILMAPGSSRGNKIQVVSKMTDCEGDKAPPLKAGLSWEAPESRTDGGILRGIS